MQARHLFTLPFVFAAVTLAFTSIAQAARIAKVKGPSVLIENEDTEIQEGDKFFVMIDGKKKGVVQITQVKNGKSLGKLTKGRAEVDAPLQPTKGGAKSADNGGGDEPMPSVKKKGKKRGGGDSATHIGILGGYAMDSQSVTDTTNTAVSMSGSGYSFKGFVDLPISGHLGVVGRSGVEQMNLSGNSTSLGAVNTAIMYATADLLVRYNFGSGGFVPFFAGGLGLHFPISKTSNILDVPRISSTTVFFGDLGFNMNIGESSYLILAGEYGYFPPSNSVTTSFMELHIGYGWRW